MNAGTGIDRYDLFISYRRLDQARVQPLVDALQSRGLTVWFDQREIGDFAPITDAIRAGLAKSKALLAWHSLDYPKSRPCQMELTAAFIAAQREGDPRQRILVINPEATAAHVEPVELRDEQQLSAPSDPNAAAGYAELAERIAAQLQPLQKVLGAILPLTPPCQRGQKLAGSNRFVGRLPDLWRLHSALHGAESAIITGAAGAGLAQVSGLGGVGKSLLAEEYALRFGAAFPGGVFWLRALGNDASGTALSAEQQDAARSDQFYSMAVALGVAVPGLSPAEVEAALGRALRQAGQPFLWVVDDLASGLNAADVRAWFAPDPLGKTLLTTRSREYGQLGNALPLGVLPPDDAYTLLIGFRRPQGAVEVEAAHGMAHDLGYHPLALAVTASALQDDPRSFAAFRAALADPSRDELELAAELADLLPTGHEPSVAATLLRSVRRLGTEGRDFLRLASLLAAAPIPVGLVTAVFAAADGLDEASVAHQTRKALAQTRKASLAEEAGANARIVHTLVSRTLRFHDENPARRNALRVAVVAALNKRLPGVVDIRAHDALAAEVLHARELCSRSIDDPETAMLATWVARHDYERGGYAVARVLQDRALERYRRELGEEHPATLMAMNNLAETLRAQGELGGARALQEGVLVVSRRVLGEEHPNTLRAMNNLALTLRAQGELGGARALQEGVLVVSRRVLGEEHPDTFTAMNNLTGTLQAQGELGRARALQEEVLAVSRRVLGEEHPNTLAAMNNLVTMLQAQGELGGARALQEEVLAVSRRVLGKEHPNTLGAMNNLAETLRAQGELGGAQALQEGVLAISHRVLGEDHPVTLRAMNNLALTLRVQGELGRVRVLQERALKACRRMLGKEHPDTLTAMNNLAGTLWTQGELDGARGLQEQVLEARRRVLGKEHPDTLTAMNNLAGTLWTQGDLGGARGLQERALEARRRVLGEEHPDTSMSAWNLFNTLWRLEETDEAQTLLRQHLFWLLDRDPNSLGADQRQIRERLIQAHPDSSA